eukprot:CAMPEP_0177540086 /NCGR_PEP_ID=MMETSP0369-20130122/59367_1 /TAXON_ID=447022 ORGANISM="Scrippsiella hangoei-like, Strain SHHI-4" /NCGR_SAMPLE_ID=MMETSP0369 /ASSEMBLY_ACC=CAM_ASM_000364 /LENGTH=78 /DNA_ID=CAMNT_0019023229 /DNA_START=500 /DNA_END=733 /DNA_ORIENTATION=+
MCWRSTGFRYRCASSMNSIKGEPCTSSNKIATLFRPSAALARYTPKKQAMFGWRILRKILTSLDNVVLRSRMSPKLWG